MRSKFKWIFALLLAFTMQFSFAQEKTITGVVSDVMGPLPGANVVVKGTQRGVSTGFDGTYSIKVKVGEQLVFSFMGLSDSVKTVGDSNTMNVVLKEDAKQLETVVVTALNVKKDSKRVTHAVQQVSAEKLNITQTVDVKAGLAGKVAGVQVNGQAGAKLGQTGKIRLRGALSLSEDKDPLYVLDGVFVDPNSVDMDNIASVSVLKGANAAALYGPAAEYGVILMSSKRGGSKLGVEISSSTVFDQVAYLPKYQNLYGQGYDGDASFRTFSMSAAYPAEFSVMEGKRYLYDLNNTADESWGPKFDGEDYVPWYAWWPNSPYYGQTAKYVAQPNNIKDFYDIGMTKKNSITVSGGNETFKARFSYTNLDQTGITPYTTHKRNYLNSNFTVDLTKNFKIEALANLTSGTTRGEFDDGYANQTSGSFNSWFGRNLDTRKMRELKDLENMDGYMVNWNWAGPEKYILTGNNNDYKKPYYWFNPYSYLERFDFKRRPNNLTYSIAPSYKFNDSWSAKVTFNRTEVYGDRKFYLPYSLSKSATNTLQLNTRINSFGVGVSKEIANYYEGRLNFKKKYGFFDVDAFVGGSVQKRHFERSNTDMNYFSNIGQLIIPDVYDFKNASITPVTTTFQSNKDVRGAFLTTTFGIKDFLFLDGTLRQDWNSGIVVNEIGDISRVFNKNGYFTYAAGFSLLLDKFIKVDAINSMKLRGGIARLSGDYVPLETEPINSITRPYKGLTLGMYLPTYTVDRGLIAPNNVNREVGLDIKMFNNRLGLSSTYYYETRKDDVLKIDLPSESGYSQKLANTGETYRKGIELSLNANIIRSEGNGFEWDFDANFAKNNSFVVSVSPTSPTTSLPGASDDWAFVDVLNSTGYEWGQLVGTGIKTDAAGNKIIDPVTGLYAVEALKNFGSVLPEFTGGFINTFRYKNFDMTASFDFQKGGKFFSLSEMWGNYTGLLEETAAMNDRGANVRDDVDTANGGVHVVGVDETGAPVDMYTPGYNYFTQFQSNTIAEPFIHDASYLKFRDFKLGYTIPSKLFNNKIQSVNIAIIGRNLMLISVSKDNKHRWDPSEMAGSYGESGQLPGTRSYGINVKVNF